MTYQIGKAGGDIKTVEFQGELLVDDAVDNFGDTDSDTEGFQVTVNGKEPEDGQMVNDGDVVVLVPDVNGG